MWSMTSVSWRVALRDAGELRYLARRKKHDGHSRLLGCGPEPVGRPSVSQDAVSAVEGDADAEHSALLLTISAAAPRIADFGAAYGHYAEAVGIALDGLQAIVVPVARPTRRHDHQHGRRRFVHHRQQPFDGEGFRKLRLEAGTQRSPQIPASTDGPGHPQSFACARVATPFADTLVLKEPGRAKRGADERRREIMYGFEGA